jgi:hypothetical protein
MNRAGYCGVALLSACHICSAADLAGALAAEYSSLSQGAPVSVSGSLLSGAQLLAAKGTSNVSLKLSRILSLAPATDAARFNTWSITASAPLNKTSDDSVIANLDGLANSSSIELGFSSFTAHGKRQAAFAISKLGVVDAVCKRAFEARLAKEGTKVPDKIEGCDSNLVSMYASDEDKVLFESTFWDLDNANRTLWGATAKLGYQDFEYIASTSTTKLKQNETPWSVGIWGAFQPQNKQLLYTLSAQYQRTYKEGTASAVCPTPVAPPAASVCLTGPLDPPKLITKKLLTAEARTRINSVGVALSVTRDFEAKTTGVEVPVYFVADKDGKLTAGVKAGWRSDTKSASFGVFVGAPFGLYK